MRDDQVYDLMRKGDEKIATVYRQMQFLNSRMQAFEMLLRDRKSIWTWLWSPMILIAQVDALQMALIKKHDEIVKNAAERVSDEARKPKIIVPSVI